MTKKYMTSIKAVLLFLLLLIVIPESSAQCQIENKYFQAGETLSYDLYFKWGLISKKSGKATLKVSNVNYGEQKAYKISLATHSQGSARKFFKMDDTITSILTQDLVPLQFTKDAHEEDNYTKEKVVYSYSGGSGVKIRSIRHKNNNFKFDETFQVSNCTYDMLSIVFYARTLNYSGMKKGNKVSVDFISGKKKLNMIIEHNGTEKLKVNDGGSYNCIKLVLKIADDAFSNEADAMTVYLTNDMNRLPIRIDSKLKIGNARVVLSSYKGNKYPIGKAN